jgi:1-acyl-sn-glycerol-3-phosphate acyltransferase
VPVKGLGMDDLPALKQQVFDIMEKELISWK